MQSLLDVYLYPSISRGAVVRLACTSLTTCFAHFLEDAAEGKLVGVPR